MAKQRAKMAFPHYSPQERDRDVFDVLKVIRDFGAREVADKSGVSASTIYNWRRPLDEGGTRFPRFKTMQLILTAFGHKLKVVRVRD